MVAQSQMWNMPTYSKWFLLYEFHGFIFQANFWLIFVTLAPIQLLWLIPLSVCRYYNKNVCVLPGSSGCKLTSCLKWCHCNGASRYCSWGCQGLCIFFFLWTLILSVIFYVWVPYKFRLDVLTIIHIPLCFYPLWGNMLCPLKS